MQLGISLGMSEKATQKIELDRTRHGGLNMFTRFSEFDLC